MKLLPLFLLMALAGPLQAQILPQPSADNPRIQSIQWVDGQEVILTALPRTGLTVVLEPGEQIRRISSENERALDVRVSAEQDSFLLLPLNEQGPTGMLVQTDRRDYRFSVQISDGLSAAYLVKFDYFQQQDVPENTQPEPTGEVWAYRIKGDRPVRPAAISDDGVRTRISFGAEQALPAVFAVGPSGDEQVVNGYMRGDVFVIDRVYSRLVFRIDKKKATARRASSPEKSDG